MLLSRVYLKVSSYAWSQYAGAGVIVAGGLLSAFGAGGAGGDEPEAVNARVFWFGPVLILIGIVPGAMSNVYKEKIFKRVDLDIYYLTTYVAVWQTILSFVCVPLFTLKYFGGIPLHEMPQNLADGWHCFMGHPLEGYLCDDPFPSTATILLLYVLVNFFFNMALLSMVKHGSALALVIAVAVALPITNLVFTQRWAMGEHDVEQLSLYNLLGIGLVVVGFLLYSLLPEPAPSGKGAKDVEGGVGVSGAGGVPTGARRVVGVGAGASPESEGEGANYEHLCREFMLPTGAAGHSLYVTEYLPSVLPGLPVAPVHGERRHSFDFHSSPSVRIVQQARKKRLARAIENKTPSRTP